MNTRTIWGGALAAVLGGAFLAGCETDTDRVTIEDDRLGAAPPVIEPIEGEDVIADDEGVVSANGTEPTAMTGMTGTTGMTGMTGMMPAPRAAVAVLHGFQDDDLDGTVRIVQQNGGMQVVANVTGLDEGSYRIAVHEFGDCTSPSAVGELLKAPSGMPMGTTGSRMPMGTTGSMGTTGAMGTAPGSEPVGTTAGTTAEPSSGVTGTTGTTGTTPSTTGTDPTTTTTTTTTTTPSTTAGAATSWGELGSLDASGHLRTTLSSADALGWGHGYIGRAVTIESGGAGGVIACGVLGIANDRLTGAM